MLKKIMALLLAAATLFALCACGDNESSEESKSENSADTSTNTSADASADASTDTSVDVSTDASTDTSEDASSGEYIDKEGYKQFLRVSNTDKTLKKRGFKDKGANSDYVPLNYDKMKAMWISQFDFTSVYKNGDNGTTQRSESNFKKVVSKAFDNLVDLGFNTVIVQVRPNADSFYPSAYYPASHYILGSYGKYAKYDALQIMVELAHEKGLSFHAWINPMRGMSSDNLGKIKTFYPMASWAGKASKNDYLYGRGDDGLLYLNISYEEVRELIINGAAEIVRNYDVDGVHMDDYFYWGEEPEFDKKAYEKARKQKPTLTLQQFRYNNLNALVSGIYSAIKEENKNVMFGISPAGNIDKMPTTYYADIKTWLSQDGYVDYIMPQIYFGMEHSSWSFSSTYQRWSDAITNPKIKLYAGMTLGKAQAGSRGEADVYAGAGKEEWIHNKDVIKKCFEFAVKQPDFSGYAIFCYQYMFDPLKGTPNPLTAEEVNNAKPYLTTKIKGKVIKY